MLSYTISLLAGEKATLVTKGVRTVITDAGGNFDFDWSWIGACPSGARLEVRISALQLGFLPLDTARVIAAPCETGSSFLPFSLFLTPELPATGDLVP